MFDDIGGEWKCWPITTMVDAHYLPYNLVPIIKPFIWKKKTILNLLSSSITIPLISLNFFLQPYIILPTCWWPPCQFQIASSRVAVRQPKLGRPQAVPRPRLPLPMQVLGQARALQDGVESAAGEGRNFWASHIWAS